MSVEAMAWAFSVPVTANTKLVLLGLANHAHKDGTNAFPGQDTLAEYASCDVRTVRRCLTRLERMGLIENAGKARFGVTNWTLSMALQLPLVSGPDKMSYRTPVVNPPDTSVLRTIEPPTSKATPIALIAGGKVEVHDATQQTMRENAGVVQPDLSLIEGTA